MLEFTPEQKLKVLKGYMRTWIGNWPQSRNLNFEHFLKKAQKDYSIRHEIKQKGFCVYCERKFSQTVKRTQDHIMPISLGGEDEEGNVVAACYNCNQWKGNKELRHWIRDLYLMKRLKMESGYYTRQHIVRMVKNVEKIIDLLRVKPSYYFKTQNKKTSVETEVGVNQN